MIFHPQIQPLSVSSPVFNMYVAVIPGVLVVRFTVSVFRCLVMSGKCSCISLLEDNH